ncbi:S-adenosyl-L-methionine-dependent methyltransferase [Infundibulicybe gibba]|nr:S-adenosyl-L-methionine-dependent methyltransferase [Infundibulicybe gibba]
MDQNHDLGGFASRNRDYFNRLALEGSDNNPNALELARRSANAFRKAYNFDDGSTIAMDFACGSGHVSRQLAPYTKSIIGVDISQRMGVSPDEMRAVCAELRGEDHELGGAKFDVIVCASAYHHFADIDKMTQVLCFSLKPGGTLLVIDLLRTDAVDDSSIFPEHAGNIVAHKGGFKPEIIQSAFEHAGLDNITLGVAVNAKKAGHNVQLFIAKGIKSDF